MKFRISTLLLAMALLCFLLPFVNVRCSQEAMNLMNQSVNGADSLASKETPAKGDLKYYYTGIQLVLGQKATEVQEPMPPVPQGDSLRQEEESDSIQAVSASPIRTDRNSADPVRLVQETVPLDDSVRMQELPETADSAGLPQPEMPMEDAPRPMPNIFALAAFLLIMIALFGTLLKQKLGLVIAAVGSVAAVAFLNVMKMTIGTYVIKTGLIMKEQMQYYELEVTNYFWICLALCVLAFVEVAFRLLTGWNEEAPLAPAVQTDSFENTSLYQSEETPEEIQPDEDMDELPVEDETDEETEDDQEEKTDSITK